MKKIIKSVSGKRNLRKDDKEKDDYIKEARIIRNKKINSDSTIKLNEEVESGDRVKSKKIRSMEEYKKEKKNSYKKGRSKVKKKICKFLGFISLFAVIIVNLCGYAKVSEMKYEIQDLESALRGKEITLEELEMKDKKGDTIKDLENNAKDILQMDYPSKSQIEYINMGD